MDLEHDESAHLTGFNRLELAEWLATQCYSTSKLDWPFVVYGKPHPRLSAGWPRGLN